jgi:predicted ATPase
VPLFIEEMAKTVLANPAPWGPSGSEPAVPGSLQTLLLARLGGLGAGRELAQIAAVIGQEFSYELLRLIAGMPEAALRAALDRLVGSELVFARGVPPLAAFVFKHALVRDAAYGILVRDRRRELHGAVARAVEASFPEIVEAQPELLAHHFGEAGEALKAVEYLVAAAERALMRSALAEAAAQLAEGLALLSGVPDDDERRRQELKLQLAGLGT